MPKENINWVNEAKACEMLGYAKKTLRIKTRDEKRKTLPIRTSKINHKTILYSGTDIENFIAERMTA